MSKTAVLAIALMGCAAGALAEEWHVPGEVIQRKTDGNRSVQSHSFLNSDVVEMELRVRDLSGQETRVSGKGWEPPASIQSLDTRAKGRWGDFFSLENGVDLAIHRGMRWDAEAGETVRESVKPRYYNRLALQPWDQSELSMAQVVSMEQMDAQSKSNELWRTSLAYRQQWGRLTDFRMEASHEEKSPDSLQLPIRTEAVGGTFSQQLGPPGLKLHLGAKNARQTREDSVMENVENFRREAGLDWKISKQVGLYGGAAMADEVRPRSLSEESIVLYELRSRWVPAANFQLSGGLSLDSRRQSDDAVSGRAKWLLRGDLQPAEDLSLFTQFQWDQWERSDSAGTFPVRDEKISLGTGPKLRLDETTRFSAEYGLSRGTTGETVREQGVEHMLSFVLSRDF